MTGEKHLEARPKEHTPDPPKDLILEEMLAHLEGEVEETWIQEYESVCPETHYRLEFVRILRKRFPQHPTRLHEIDLVVSELLGNVSHHVMEDGEGVGRCRASSYFARSGVVFVAEDSGLGFDVEEKGRVIHEGYPFTKEHLRDLTVLSGSIFYGEEIHPQMRELVTKGGVGLRILLAFSTHYAHNEVGNKVYVHFAI